jgi:hypothetical protein
MVSGDVAFFRVGALLRNMGGGAHLPETLRESREEKIGTCESSALGDSSKDSMEGSIKGNSSVWRLHKG